MRIADVLLASFDAEIDSTHRLFDRIPNDKGEFKPHDKSMLFGKLASHIATLPLFGLIVLTTPELDMGSGFPQFPTPVTKDECKAALTESAAKVRRVLETISDEEMLQTWQLKFGEKVFVNGTRLQAFNPMFFHHFIHHRAQLGVYLRLLDCPIPGMYGPSADEPMGA